jgi:hypothetical protein
MPAPRTRARSDSARTSIDLSDLLTAVADAVLEAKSSLDREAAALADAYRSSPGLELASPPSFGIGEVRFVVKYAVAQAERAAPTARGKRRQPLKVHVDAATLGELAPHLISEIELRILPEVRLPQMTEEEIDGIE